MPELLTYFMSFLSQIKSHTEGLRSECWEVRCQPSPSLKGQIRYSTGSKIPLFTFTRNLVIPGANHCSDPQCMCTRIRILIGHLCFHFQGTLVQQYWDVLRNLEGKGIPHLWLEYCWVHANRLSPGQELIRSTWSNFLSPRNARTIISLIRSPWPNSPYFHAGLIQWKDMSLLQSPYHLGFGGSRLVVLDQIYVGHVDLHRPVKFM